MDESQLIVVNGKLRRAISFMVILGMLVFAGLVAMTMPSAVRADGSSFQTVSRLGLVLAEVWLSLDSVWERRERQALIESELRRIQQRDVALASPPTIDTGSE